jgi:hypothetical protein
MPQIFEMKILLNISAVLSWFNGVIASLLVLFGLIMVVLVSADPTTLISLLLVSSVILHSYAALQLRKTLAKPEILLSRQTPTGIRFIGLAALLYAMINGSYSIMMIQHSSEFIKQFKNLPGAQNMSATSVFPIAVALSILFSATVATNVILNLRLLGKWYRGQQEK